MTPDKALFNMWVAVKDKAMLEEWQTLRDELEIALTLKYGVKDIHPSQDESGKTEIVISLNKKQMELFNRWLIRKEKG